MRKNHYRFLVILIAMTMAVLMAPLTVSAATQEVHVSSFAEIDQCLTQLKGAEAKIVLDQDISMGKDEIIIVEVGDFTLDLNGHTISKKDDSDPFGTIIGLNSGLYDGYSAKLTVTGNGTIRYEDNEFQGTGVFYCSADDSLVIANGTYYGYSIITNDGTVKVNGGSFTADTIINNGYTGTIRINGGDYHGLEMNGNPSFLNSNVILVDNSEKGNGSMTITGGTFDGGASEGGLIKIGHVKVTGGTFIGKAVINASVVDTSQSLEITGGDFTNGGDFFAYDDGDMAIDSQRLIVSDKANLTSAQKNSIKKAITLGDSVSLAKASVTGISNKTYTGKAIKPAVTVKLKGEKLVKGEDYTVSYKNNKKVGKATVTIQGTGEYMGTYTKTFKINPKKPVISSAKAGKGKVTVKMKTKASSTGAKSYEIAYRVKGTSKWKSVTTTAKSKTVKGLKKGKKYQIKVRAFKTVGGATYRSGWSAVKIVKAL